MSRLNLQTVIRNIHIWVGLIAGIVFCEATFGFNEFTCA